MTLSNSITKLNHSSGNLSVKKVKESMNNIKKNLGKFHMGTLYEGKVIWNKMEEIINNELGKDLI